MEGAVLVSNEQVVESGRILPHAQLATAIMMGGDDDDDDDDDGVDVITLLALGRRSPQRLERSK
ncbi:hypothetical protein Dda_0472 [Drechslerella dactyloides]|uniref:Uncharacterized protein n=1 Tax=Drechslerella dactyloides TaxID=74499 RepID=A0AAD6J7V8_DREDA|nr:hypothetical protein Dda_0472 [Drechslerella dactyloides]